MSAWVDPTPTVSQKAAQNALLPVSSQLHAAGPRAVAFAPAGMSFPAMAAIRADVADEQCWEISGIPNRFSSRDLMFMSSEWRLLSSGVDGEVGE